MKRLLIFPFVMVYLVLAVCWDWGRRVWKELE
jgi:hypothetical protein